MPVQKISEMTAITGSTTASDDLFLVVDSSTNITKKITRAELNNAIEQDVIASIDITTANIDGGTIDGVTIGGSSAGAGTFTSMQINNNCVITGDLTVTGDDITMGTNTAGNLLIADGTNFNSVAVGSLSEISTVASDDVLLCVDTSGGGLKRITRATLTAGLAATGAITNIVEDTTPQLGGDLDGQDKNLENVVLSSASSHAGRYGSSSAPITFTVTVASKSGHPYQGDGSGLAYLLNGLQSPALTFYGVDNVTSDSGYYYRFDQSDSSNGGHPLRFYLDADKTTAFTTGVTTNGTAGSSGAYTQIVVTEDTPSILYYQCSNHGYMGNHAVVLGSNKINHSEALIDMPTSSGTLALTSQLPTSGISSGNVATFTSGAVDNDFLRIDGTSIEGRSASEVLSDIGVTFGIANTNTVKIDSSSVANGEFAKFTANGLESRSVAELSSDIGAATTDDIIALSIALG
tara:strand:+ start:53 stop:1441 length:1389 start_codon:yes stop_codon:yes gene_type:complete